MDDFEYWRLCDELSVMHAAILVQGGIPSSGRGYPPGYQAIEVAIAAALRTGRIFDLGMLCDSRIARYLGRAYLSETLRHFITTSSTSSNRPSYPIARITARFLRWKKIRGSGATICPFTISPTTGYFNHRRKAQRKWG